MSNITPCPKCKKEYDLLYYGISPCKCGYRTSSHHLILFMSSLAIFIIIAIFTVYILYDIFNKKFDSDTAVSLIFASIAIIIGFLSLFKDTIVGWIDKLDISLEKKELKCEIFTDQLRKLNCSKSYNLIIKNIGFHSIKNLKAKIRKLEEDGNAGSWLRLTRPFYKSAVILEDKKIEIETDKGGGIYIENLSPNEEDEFNLGFLDTKSIFRLTVNTILGTNAQEIEIKEGGEATYSLEMVAENMSPKYYKIKIKYLTSVFHINNIEITRI